MWIIVGTIGCQEFALSFFDVVQKLVAKLGLSEKDAEEMAQKYWQ